MVRAPGLLPTTAISLSRAPNLPVYLVYCSQVSYSVLADTKGIGKQWPRTLGLPQETSTEGELEKVHSPF